MKISKFGPKGVGSPLASRQHAGRTSASTGATCVFYEDRSNFVTFQLRTFGKASGARGNKWMVLLYKVSSGRFSFRLVNPAGDILVTITRTGGVANLVSAVNTNATVGNIVNMRITGTIDDDTTFASSITDYCHFNGGS